MIIQAFFFNIKDWILHTYKHSDTGQDGTARGVTHYNWFCYKYLGSATLSWFRYFTLLVCCEHLSRNLLKSYCATPRVFSILWICSYVITYFSLFTIQLRDACETLYSAADDSCWCFWCLCAWERLPVSSGKIWSAIIDLGSPENPDSWVMAKYPVPGYCGKTAEMLWWGIWLGSQGEG